LAAAALVLPGAAVSAPAVRTAEGPPAGFSGGFGEPTCVACHTGNDLNAFGGRVTIEGLPAAYVPGRAYPLTVVLEAEETEVAGFQITARFAGGARAGGDAGRLEPLDGRVAKRDSAGVTYAHQTAEGSKTATSDGSAWTLTWIAPVDGDVAIHLAANSGNGDNSPLSDLVYTREVLLGPESPRPR